jgi:transcriptional regulator with XRE-family HTH domain
LLRTLVGNVLRRNRLGQRRTLAEVARDARVSMPYLSEVERGRKEVSSEVLAAVCDALGIELADLLAEVGRDLAPDRATDRATDRAPVLTLRPARRHHDLTPRAHYRPVSPPVPPGLRGGDVVLLAA